MPIVVDLGQAEATAGVNYQNAAPIHRRFRKPCRRIGRSPREQGALTVGACDQHAGMATWISASCDMGHTDQGVADATCPRYR